MEEIISQYEDEYGCLVSEVVNDIGRKIKITYENQTIAILYKTGAKCIRYYSILNLSSITQITKEQWDLERNRLLILNEL